MARFSNYGRASGVFKRFGQSRQVIPEETKQIDYPDFFGGYDARLSRDKTPPNASYNAVNVEVTHAGHLRKMAGTTLLEALTPRTPRQMAIHRALSGYTELVLFNPPYIGVKRVGATTWTDVTLELANNNFVWATYGEKFIFYNGMTVWLREPGNDPVAVATIPGANSYATFAARLYCGGAVIDGVTEPMGLSWSDTTGDPTSFDEAQGAGSELLLDEVVSGDRIVALRTLGLKQLAILCRHSIWVASFTGIDERPADPVPIQPIGGGCIAEPTAKNTSVGIIYLAEDGVRLFDGNVSKVISEQINDSILPLTQLSTPFNAVYSAFYNPVDAQYWLLMPDATWILDLNSGRWLKSSMVLTSGTFFAEQIAGETWATIVGDWSAYGSVPWSEVSDRETDQADILLLGSVGGNVELHELDSASETLMGAAFSGIWDTPVTRDGPLDRLQHHCAINVDQKGTGTAKLYLPDHNGDFELAKTADYVSGNSRLITNHPVVHTGLGNGIRFELEDRALTLAQAQLLWKPGPPRITQEPIIVTLAPSNGVVNTTVDVAVVGRNFHPESTVAISGPGLTIQNVVRVDSTLITLRVVIAPGALVANRQLTVSGPTGTSAPAIFVVKGQPASVFLWATFTGAAGTDIALVPPEVGGAWVNTVSVCILSDANRARGTGGGGVERVAQNSVVPPSANYRVYGDFRRFGGGGANLFARYLSGVTTGYNVFLNIGAARWELYAPSGILGSSPVDFPAIGETKKGEIRVVGNQISVYIQDALRIGPITNNEVAAANKPAIRFFTPFGDADGVHLDNVFAEAA